MPILIKIQDSQLVGYQMTNDYKGKDFTASVTTVNNDIIQNSGKFVIQLKSIHRLIQI